MLKRSLYYESPAEEDDENAVDSPAIEKKATSLSARFKAIAKHDKRDYQPSDESYDSQEEAESLSDAENLLASPITPFGKSKGTSDYCSNQLAHNYNDCPPDIAAQSRLLEKPKPVVSAAHKPKKGTEAHVPSQLAYVAPVKTTQKPAAPSASGRPLGTKQEKSYSTVSTPGLKARIFAALHSDDEEEETEPVLIKVRSDPS